LKKYKNVEFLFIAVCELDLLIKKGDGFLLFELLYIFTKFYFFFACGKEAQDRDR